MKNKNKSKIKGPLKKPKKLFKILKKHSGRDSSGKISVRHQGGRQKRYYRIIDQKRDKLDLKGEVVRIEYDPNRSAHIALIKYTDGEKRYILHVKDLKIGDKIISSNKNIDFNPGNSTILKNIPIGQAIHNLELYPGQGGQIAKGAGSSTSIIAKDNKYAQVKLPSKEIRKILLNCRATIGQVSNLDHKFKIIKKAGTKRHMGIRPTVRGVAQNPGSHPHGGGEGRSGQGMHPKTPWGKKTLGKKTRKNKRSKKLIIKSRKG